MSIHDPEEPKPTPRAIAVDLTLRTQQVEYLEYLSDRDESSLSYAMAKIIAKAKLVIVLEQGRPAQKIRKHLTLSEAHVGFIDRLAVTWGIPRNDVARRLIDAALATDKKL